MPENNDYSCKVCGKHFSEEDDYKNHGERDHPEVNEAYPDLFNKKEEPREVPQEAEEFDWSEVPEEEWDDVVLRKVNGEPKEEETAEEDEYSDDLGDFTDKPTKGKYDDRPVVQGEPVNIVGEIEKQEDKPIQTHDDWQEELEGLKDEFATEQEKCAICNGEHPTSEHPVLAQEEETKTEIDPNEPEEANEEEEDHPRINISYGYGDKARSVKDFDELRDIDKKEGEEEGGADDPLSKVADLAESYRYMSRDRRTNIFESLGFGQGDSAILSGLEWNELTRPVKVEASEAYIKEQEEPEEEAEETEEDEENKAYENLYNLEKYHSSPDYKKKSLTCNKCNEAFYNNNDRNVHYNDVHAQEQDYKLPETCPYCNIEIHEPENLDWHMQEEHGAHVPSQFTQTGVQGAMADTDFDSLESHKKKAGEAYAKEAKWECLDCDQEFDDAGKHLEDTGHHNIVRSHASESSSASDLREDIRKQKEFINMASFENPMNMGDAEDKLHNLESELESLGGEELEATEEDDYEVDIDEYLKTGEPVQKLPSDKRTFDVEQEDDWWGSPEETEKDIYDLGHPEEVEEGGPGSGPTGSPSLLPEQSAMKNINPDYDPFKSTPKSQLMQTDPYVTRTTEGEDEPVEKWDKDDDIGRNYAEPTGDDEPLDDDSYWQGRMEEAKEQYDCPTCGDDFGDPESLEEHQYANYHGKYEDEGEGEDMPRNVMGGQ